MKSTDLAQLEQMVDKLSIIGVLDHLEEICYLKAQHLQENWQDRKSAKHWEKRAKQIQKAKIL